MSLQTKQHKNSKIDYKDLKKKRSHQITKRSPVQLNVDQPVETVTDVVFPWTSNTSLSTSQEGAWPYILQPKLKPNKNINEENVPAISIQAGRRFKKTRKTLRKRSSEEIYVFKLPEQEDTVQLEKISLTSSQISSSGENDDIEEKHNEISKKLKNKISVTSSKEHMLPLFASDHSPYANNPIPGSVHKIIPREVHKSSIMQCGKPWHNVEECTWIDDISHLSTKPIEKKSEKSPRIEWGKLITQKQKYIYNREYKNRPKELKFDKSSGKSIQTNTFKNLYSKLCAQSMQKEVLLSPIKESSSILLSQQEDFIPYQTSSSTKLLMLSYFEEQDKKCIPVKPDVPNIDEPWNYLIKRKWPSNIVRTVFFRKLRKIRRSIQTKIKMPLIGEWPYVSALIKKDDNIILPQKRKTSQTYQLPEEDEKKIKQSDWDIFSMKSTSRLKKESAETILCRSIVTDELLVSRELKVKTFQKNEPLYQPLEILPYTLTDQLPFTGSQIYQESFIDTQNTKAQFTYQLSDLKFYELNYTHLVNRRKYFRLAFYYSTLYNNAPDPFAKKRIDFYPNKKMLLTVPESGFASIFYPNGQEAIRCTYGCIKNRNDLPVRRYTIYSCDKRRTVLGVFDSLGAGIIYDGNGRIRLNYSQNFGTYFETNSGRPMRWRWHNIPMQDGCVFCRTDSIENFQIPATEIEEMRLRDINLFNEYLKVLNEELEKVHSSHEQTLDPNTCFLSNPLAYHKNGSINWGFYVPLKPIRVKINDFIQLDLNDQRHIRLKFTYQNKKQIKIQLGIVINPNVILKTGLIEESLILHQNIPCEFDFIAGQTLSLLEILQHLGGNRSKLDSYLNPPDRLIKYYEDNKINLLEVVTNLKVIDVAEKTKKGEGSVMKLRQKSAQSMRPKSSQSLIKSQSKKKKNSVEMLKHESRHKLKESKKDQLRSPLDSVLTGSKTIFLDLLEHITSRKIPLLNQSKQARGASLVFI